MICTYFKLCVLELSEKNAARQGGGERPPSPPRLAAILFQERTANFFRAIER